MSAIPAEEDRQHLSLSVDDLEYHRRLIEQMKACEDMQRHITAIAGAWQSWSEHLTIKYALSPTDTIDEDGHIVGQ